MSLNVIDGHECKLMKKDDCAYDIQFGTLKMSLSLYQGKIADIEIHSTTPTDIFMHGEGKSITFPADREPIEVSIAESDTMSIEIYKQDHVSQYKQITTQ